MKAEASDGVSEREGTWLEHGKAMKVSRFLSSFRIHTDLNIYQGPEATVTLRSIRSPRSRRYGGLIGCTRAAVLTGIILKQLKQRLCCVFVVSVVYYSLH